MRKKLTLETFLPDIEHPTRGTVVLRDIANIPSAALTPFFQNPNIIVNNSVQQLPDDEDDATPSVIWNPDRKDFTVHPRLTPKPGRLYSLAGDLSVSGDNTGISMVHIEPDGRIELDFSLKISASPRVDYVPIEDFFISLRDDLGFTILGISFDQFQSNRTISRLVDAGFDAKVVRYADSLAGCSTISDIIHSGNFIYHQARDKDFIGEAMELQLVNDKRVDHMTSGGIYNSKDVWDSAVNATTRALEDGKAGGLRLMETDLTLRNWNEIHIAIQQEKVNRKRGEKPSYAHFAFVYTRLDQEQQSDAFCLAHIAKDTHSNTLYLLDIMRENLPMHAIAQRVVDFMEAQKDSAIGSTIMSQPIEIATQDNVSADHLNDAIYPLNKTLVLSKSQDEISTDARIEFVKELVKDKKLVFNTRWFDNKGVSRVVRKLMAYPYVTDDYDLQALAGACKDLLEIEVSGLADAKAAPTVIRSGISGT